MDELIIFDRSGIAKVFVSKGVFYDYSGRPLAFLDDKNIRGVLYWITVFSIVLKVRLHACSCDQTFTQIVGPATKGQIVR
jgi:hypothetical protein